jgi:hypothetical protein
MNPGFHRAFPALSDAAIRGVGCLGGLISCKWPALSEAATSAPVRPDLMAAGRIVTGQVAEIVVV